MTTEELAECLGVAKQTVNRWIREKGWKTEKFPGVKGGRARLILVDTQVCEFIQNTPAFHNTPMLMEAEERIAEYAPGARAPAYRQIINALSRKKSRNFCHVKEFAISSPVSILTNQHK